MKRKEKVSRICAYILAAAIFMGDTLPALALAPEELSVGQVVFDGAEPKQEVTPSDGQEKDDGLIYVDGKVYSGYYLDNAGIMCIVSEGAAKPATGMLGKGTFYYNSARSRIAKLSRKTLYVNGKLYSGYYMDSKNKMYTVKKGICTLKTGKVKKGTQYYSGKTGKIKKQSKQKLYVKGKVYSGYYLNKRNKMYHVKKGTLTLKTGFVKKGTKYYNYNAKRTKKLSEEILYVKGKQYSGYYLNKKNIMYQAKKGTPALVTGIISKGVRYYRSQSKKTEILSADTLYVEGKVYNGYYLGSDNKMYTLSNGIYTPVDTALDAGTVYYSYMENRLMTLPAAKVYLDGKAIEGLSPSGIAAFQKARSIVQSVSNTYDSKADKLYKCYLWIKKCPYVQYRTTMNAITVDPADWDSTFANDIFAAFTREL